MSLTVTSLASGSSGNALLLRYEGHALLVDCGLSQRAIERALAHAALAPAQVCAVLLTHEHGDHVGCAGPFARRHGLAIAANRGTHDAIGDRAADIACTEIPTGTQQAIGPFQIRSFSLPHDAADPVGYTVQAGGVCVGIAIDFGSWSANVASELASADLIVIEANYDQERLRSAPYAWPIKQRIYGERGHLDNVDAGRLLSTIGADGRRRTAWLAHLSREANSPEVALRVVNGMLRMASVRCIDVHALPRRAPLSWAGDEYAEQLALF
jgi:phosphoribosyl 1,2-cyclic phosphodiesterase